MGSMAELGEHPKIETTQAGPLLGSQLNHAFVGSKITIFRTLIAEMAFRSLPWEQASLHCMTIQAFWTHQKLGQAADAART